MSCEFIFHAGQSQADTIAGPGDVYIDANDSAISLLIVDLTASRTLDAGNYLASTFNYQFSHWGGNGVGGTVAPFLATYDGSHYNVIAVGDSVLDPLGVPTSFRSATFGGSNTFTLGSTTTVFAGLYEQNIPGYRQPIGFANGGASYLLYNSGLAGTGNVDFPVVGSGISGGNATGTFARSYDFSIGIVQSPVPEPSSAAMFSIGAAALLAYSRRKVLGRPANRA